MHSVTLFKCDRWNDDRSSFCPQITLNLVRKIRLRKIKYWTMCNTPECCMGIQKKREIYVGCRGKNRFPEEVCSAGSEGFHGGGNEGIEMGQI